MGGGSFVPNGVWVPVIMAVFTTLASIIGWFAVRTLLRIEGDVNETGEEVKSLGEHLRQDIKDVCHELKQHELRENDRVSGIDHRVSRIEGKWDAARQDGKL